jgi:hypothetical protein
MQRTPAFLQNKRKIAWFFVDILGLPGILTTYNICFFSLIVLVEQNSLLYIFSSDASQRTANSEVPSQMAAHLRTAVYCRLGRLLYSNPGLQFHNLVSLPMSHHCSLQMQMYLVFFCHVTIGAHLPTHPASSSRGKSGRQK